MPKETERVLELQEIVCDSQAFKKVLRQAMNAAKKSESIVLIAGEPGTGKELFARAIHRMGNRRTQSFIKLNCSSLAPAQLEEALFGYGRGRLEKANQGTLLLTHIENISRKLQIRLLRVFVEKGFQSPRSSTIIPVDVRLIATTSDTGGRIEDSWLYKGLFHEFNVSTIMLPALRERRRDIPRLAWHFIAKWSRVMNKSIDVISPETMKALMNYHWPNNVRELDTVIERAVGSTDGTELRADIPAERARRA